MNQHKKSLTQEEHWDNDGVIRCSNCNYMSFPDTGILAELLTEPEWDDKDKNKGDRQFPHWDCCATWAGCFMSIDFHEDVYHARVSFQFGEGGWFFQGEKKTLNTAKNACIKAIKKKYRLMLEVDAEKQHALYQSHRIALIPEHLKEEDK